MKKTFLIVSMVTVLGAIAAVYGGYTPDKTGIRQGNNLIKVEALANCEVSSNASENVGYCAPLLNKSGDSCNQTGDQASVRCSGNI